MSLVRKIKTKLSSNQNSFQPVISHESHITFNVKYNLKIKSTFLFNYLQFEINESLDCEQYFTKQNNLLITAWSKLWNRNFILNNKLKFAENTRFEDNQFSIPAYILAKKISNVNLKVYSYRIRPNSISTSKVTNSFLEQFFTHRIGSSLIALKSTKNFNFRNYIKIEISKVILRSYFFILKGLKIAYT